MIEVTQKIYCDLCEQQFGESTQKISTGAVPALLEPYSIFGIGSLCRTCTEQLNKAAVRIADENKRKD